MAERFNVANLEIMLLRKSENLVSVPHEDPLADLLAFFSVGILVLC
jgi:hypothetical protein